MPLSIVELLKPKPTPKQQSLLDFLDKDKSRELFSVADLIERHVACASVITRSTGLLSAYSVRMGNKLWFAKPSVIAEFKRMAAKVGQ